MKALSVLLVASLLFACGRADPPVRRYHTRGLVKEVSQDRGELSVTIHHERIESFEDRDGKRSAMDSMRMVFGTASEVPKQLFQPEAKLSFDFDVRWSQQPTLLIVQASELAPETELQLTEGHH